MARVRAAGCSRGDFEVATVGFIPAPLWPLGICNSSGNDRERLTAIILHPEHPDHMQMRQALRMPSFVAEKSQYRNCQWQEWLAFSHRRAGGAKPKFRHWHHGRLNWLAAELFETNLFESNDPTAARCRDNAAAGRGAMTRHRNNVAGAGNSPTMSSW
jgi:hypothetical protein